MAQSAVTVEYTDCVTAEGQDSPTTDDCPRYDFKQSDCETFVMLEL